MEGLVCFLGFFFMFEATFSGLFLPCGRIPTGLCPCGCSSITEIKFNEYLFDSPSVISNVLQIGQEDKDLS